MQLGFLDSTAKCNSAQRVMKVSYDSHSTTFIPGRIEKHKWLNICSSPESKDVRMSRIAEIIGVHKSTISREIKRNTGGRGYRPIQAQWLCDQRKQGKYKGLFSSTDWHLVKYLLVEQQWSPEQISLRLKEDNILGISHERIYQHVILDKRTGGDLHTHLRERTKRRKRYGSGKQRRGTIPILVHPLIVALGY